MTSGTRDIESLRLETEKDQLNSWQTMLRAAVPRHIKDRNLQASKYARSIQISPLRSNSNGNSYTVSADSQNHSWNEVTFEELVQDVMIVLTIPRSPIGKSFKSILDIARTMTIVKDQLNEAIRDTLSFRVRKSYSTKFYQRFGAILGDKPFELLGEVDRESIGGPGNAYGVRKKCDLLLLDGKKLNTAIRIFSTYEPEEDSKEDSWDDERVNMRREYTNKTLLRALEDINETLAAALTVRFVEKAIEGARPDLFPRLTGLASEIQPEGGVDLAAQDEQSGGLHSNGLPFSDLRTSSRLDGTKTTEGDPLLNELLDRELETKVNQAILDILSDLTEKEKIVFVNLCVHTPKTLIANKVGSTTQNLSQVAHRVHGKIKDVCSTIFIDEEHESGDLTEIRLMAIRRVISQLRPFLIVETIEVS